MQATSQARDIRDREELSSESSAATDANSADDPTALAEEAEAEAAALEAAAAAARARLDELRKSKRLDGNGDSVLDADGDDGEDPADQGGPGELRPMRKRRRWGRPSSATIFTIVAMVVTCALLAAGGYLFWQHQGAEREQHSRAEFVSAAGQAVVTLMSINSSTAQDDVQRIVDNSAGQFRDDFQQSAKEFVDVAKQSKVATKASVLAAAVESMTDHSAIVLVTAATTITNSAGTNQQPRTWRLSVEVVDEMDQIKMSKVDFVP